uniref:Uncharacterized protein n=1 Tax=Rhabditophanes sp. KR3021 TaxID=114890 RepID=A0AC35UCU2_9BILA
MVESTNAPAITDITNSYTHIVQPSLTTLLPPTTTPPLSTTSLSYFFDGQYQSYLPVFLLLIIMGMLMCACCLGDRGNRSDFDTFGNFHKQNDPQIEIDEDDIPVIVYDGNTGSSRMLA